MEMPSCLSDLAGGLFLDGDAQRMDFVVGVGVCVWPLGEVRQMTAPAQLGKSPGLVSKLAPLVAMAFIRLSLLLGCRLATSGRPWLGLGLGVY